MTPRCLFRDPRTRGGAWVASAANRARACKYQQAPPPGAVFRPAGPSDPALTLLAVRAPPPGVAEAPPPPACLPGSARSPTRPAPSPAPTRGSASPGPGSSARGPGGSCLRMSCASSLRCTQRGQGQHRSSYKSTVWAPDPDLLYAKPAKGSPTTAVLTARVLYHYPKGLKQTGMKANNLCTCAKFPGEAEAVVEEIVFCEPQ